MVLVFWCVSFEDLCLEFFFFGKGRGSGFEGFDLGLGTGWHFLGGRGGRGEGRPPPPTSPMLAKLTFTQMPVWTFSGVILCEPGAHQPPSRFLLLQKQTSVYTFVRKLSLGI